MVGWKFKIILDRVILKKIVEFFFFLEVEIMIDDSFVYIVKVFGCFFFEDYFFYVIYWCLVRNILVCEIVRELECYKFCCGVEVSELIS